MPLSKEAAEAGAAANHTAEQRQRQHRREERDRAKDKLRMTFGSAYQVSDLDSEEAGLRKVQKMRNGRKTGVTLHLFYVDDVQIAVELDRQVGDRLYVVRTCVDCGDQAFGNMASYYSHYLTLNSIEAADDKTLDSRIEKFVADLGKLLATTPLCWTCMARRQDERCKSCGRSF